MEPVEPRMASFFTRLFSQIGRYIDGMAWLESVFKKHDPKQKAMDEYNLGLAAKYRGEWEESLARNRRAAELNSEDEASLWNLGIAATALRDWSEARRAWLACGVTLLEGDGEPEIAECWGCVRLNPDSSGEVVWGKRIDPARIRVMNVPLPKADRRYGDIILNDGAEEGTRTSRGRDYPVFNELALWKRSNYSTYEVQVGTVSGEARESLRRLCEGADMAFEDWGTVRILCAQCSLGNPGAHQCADLDDAVRPSRFGFAARGRSVLDELLGKWAEVEPALELGPVVLAVSGSNA